jgi:hypothetical protein
MEGDPVFRRVAGHDPKQPWSLPGEQGPSSPGPCGADFFSYLPFLGSFEWALLALKIDLLRFSSDQVIGTRSSGTFGKCCTALFFPLAGRGQGARNLRQLVVGMELDDCCSANN